MDGCANWLKVKKGETSWKVLQACLCKNRHCPLCAQLKAFRIAEQIKNQLIAYLSDNPGKRVLHVVFTQKNNAVEVTDAVVRQCSRAYNRLGIGRQDKLATGEYKYPLHFVEGYVRKLEATYSKSLTGDTHLHSHNLFVVDEGYFARSRTDVPYLTAEDYGQMWSDAMGLDYTSLAYVTAIDASNVDKLAWELSKSSYHRDASSVSTEFDARIAYEAKADLPFSLSELEELDAFGESKMSAKEIWYAEWIYQIQRKRVYISGGCLRGATSLRKHEDRDAMERAAAVTEPSDSGVAVGQVCIFRWHVPTCSYVFDAAQLDTNHYITATLDRLQTLDLSRSQRWDAFARYRYAGADDVAVFRRFDEQLYVRDFFANRTASVRMQRVAGDGVPWEIHKVVDILGKCPQKRE